MAIIKLEPGKPEQLSLRYKSPKQVKGLNGQPEFQFNLVNGNVLFLPPVAADEIKSLNLDAGDPFTILKTIGDGNEVKFQVERVPQPKPMARAESVVRENRTTEIGWQPTLTTAQSQALVRQLVATIQAVKAAEQFSISIDRPVTFGPEDIRALAISSFIEQQKRKVAA